MFQLAITIGAAARLTRLATTDTITRGSGQPGDATDHLGRAVLYDRAQRAALATGGMVPPPKNPAVARTRAFLFGMLNCDWCAGMWVAAPVTIASAVADQQRQRGSTPYWFSVPAALLTASYVTGFLASHEGE